jgi:hypothetical protein
MSAYHIFGNKCSSLEILPLVLQCFGTGQLVAGRKRPYPFVSHSFSLSGRKICRSDFSHPDKETPSQDLRSHRRLKGKKVSTALGSCQQHEENEDGSFSY